MRARVLVLVLVLVTVPGWAVAQNATRRLAEVRDGAAHLTFAVRGRSCWSEGRHITSDECTCGPGVADVRISFAAGRVTSLHLKVRRSAAAAPTPDGAGVSLGRLSAPEAAELLLKLAAQGGADGEELVAVASIADSAVVWPRLLELARDGSLPGHTRRAAVFWLSQAAGDAATHGLDSIASDSTGSRELREHAVFALSQRPPDEGVPALIRIARGHGDPAIRRKAVFWLGQTDDARALALFEDILRQ